MMIFLSIFGGDSLASAHFGHQNAKPVTPKSLKRGGKAGWNETIFIPIEQSYKKKARG
jgi:hypothetical protein